MGSEVIQVSGSITFWAAFLKAQAAMPPIGKHRSATIETQRGGSYSYKFADLGDVVAAVTPYLHANGLTFTQPPFTDGDRVGVETWIVHESGHKESFGRLLLPMGADARTAGSAITYARRYALLAALGLVADEDDDGAATVRQTTPPSSVSDAYAQRSTPIEGYDCPSCGTPVTNNLVEHFKDNKKPAFRCANSACAGGGPKKTGGGNWPWATWDANFFRTEEPSDEVPVREDYPPGEFPPGEEPF